ncbi:MAG: AbrB/MazE/SpoVT family DNA-binding domain-containing protein [Desulfotomaculales bacterium]
MRAPKEVAIRLDNKCRVTLPKSMRQALGVDAGDIVLVRYDPEENQVRLAPAVSPFDVLAEEAVREYRAGETKTIEECAREHGLRLNE